MSFKWFEFLRVITTNQLSTKSTFVKLNILRYSERGFISCVRDTWIKVSRLYTMGCTPSMQVNQSGVVHCSQHDDSPGTGQLTGVQGHFRPTCDGEEGTSKEAHQFTEPTSNGLSAFEEELLQGSVLFQKKAQRNEVCLFPLPNLDFN